MYHYNKNNVSCSLPPSSLIQSNPASTHSPLSYQVRLEYLVVYRIYSALLNRDMAQRILHRYLSPTLLERDDKQSDRICRRIALLLRDLLYVWELGVAISDGDWGRIEDILCPLAKLFRGAGSTNYCTEILHFIHQLKKIWPFTFG